MKTENLSTLKIHKLTQAQYEREREAGRLDENALYLTPDETTTIEAGTKVPANAAEMKTLTIGGETFEVVDEQARNSFVKTLSYVSSKDECTDTTKLYVLPDGNIYAYTTDGTEEPPTIEIENGVGSGYWGYADNGNQEWFAMDGIYCKRTNTIPVTLGDKFRYKGLGQGNAPSVVWLDANEVKIGQERYESLNDYISITVPNGASYARFHSVNYVADVSKVVLSVEWEYYQPGTGWAWRNTGKTLMPPSIYNRMSVLEEQAIESEATEKRVTTLEQSVGELSANAVMVDKSVEFTWLNTSAFASASVGKAIKENEIGEGQGYGYTCIPVSEDEVYTIIGAHAWQSFCWALADADGIILSISENPSDGCTPIEAEIAIPTGAAYLYFNKYGFTSLTKKTAVPTTIDDILFNKKIVYDGDSIAESRTYTSSGGNGGAYAKIIADLTYGKYDNQAVGGGYLRSTSALGKTNHSVVDNLANLPTDGDLYCFEGGINDYWNNATLGTYTLNDFTGELDKTTICGALETIFRYALNNFQGKPICFVITHKIQGTAYGKNGAGNTFKDYRDAMVDICEKYSIPYYDAFSESGLNGWNDAQNNLYLNSNTNGTADGCHPNAEGYKRYYVPQLLALFRKIMPVE